VCLVDSCSDITIARRDVLSSLRPVDAPVVVAHLGGDTILREAGTLQLGVPGVDSSIATLHDVLAVGILDLPDGVIALLGVGDVRRLGLSLDAILARPGCNLTDALVAGPFAEIPAARVEGDCWPERGDERSSSSEQPASLNRSVLLELQARARVEQEERTIARIGRLFIESPPSGKISPVKRGSPRESPARQLGNGRGSPSESYVSPSSPGTRRGGKFYAVRVGRETGIFLSWGECQAVVSGHSGAEFKSFKLGGKLRTTLGYLEPSDVTSVCGCPNPK
jgi:hypothetical protein